MWPEVHICHKLEKGEENSEGSAHTSQLDFEVDSWDLSSALTSLSSFMITKRDNLRRQLSISGSILDFSSSGEVYKITFISARRHLFLNFLPPVGEERGLSEQNGGPSVLGV